MTQAFWQDGYAIMDGLLDQSKIDLVSAAMNLSRRGKVMQQRNDHCVWEAEDEYSPFAGEMLLRHCRPALEQVVGRVLLETYAYWRIYRPGAKLLAHKDRAACEISVSVTIATEPDAPAWPFFIEDLNGTTKSIDLPPGTGIVYQGHRIAHWRRPLEGHTQKQLLLHYVLKDGEYSDHAFDERDTDPLKTNPR